MSPLADRALLDTHETLMAPSQGTPILVSRHKRRMQGCHDAGSQEDMLRNVAFRGAASFMQRTDTRRVSGWLW